MEAEIRRLRAALERIEATEHTPLSDYQNALQAWAIAKDTLSGEPASVPETSGEHVHSDECWEPDSGCDMGRNDAHAVVEERCEHGIPRRFCTAVHPSENGEGDG